MKKTNNGEDNLDPGHIEELLIFAATLTFGVFFMICLAFSCTAILCQLMDKCNILAIILLYYLILIFFSIFYVLKIEEGKDFGGSAAMHIKENPILWIP